jgi:hypothetical protein
MGGLLGIGAAALGALGALVCAAGIGLGWWAAARTADRAALVAARLDDRLSDAGARLERTYRPFNLRGVAVLFFNWVVALMSHPVLVFDFGPDGRVCTSIEVRSRKGQPYSILRSVYRRQELTFLAADRVRGPRPPRTGEAPP